MGIFYYDGIATFDLFDVTHQFIVGETSNGKVYRSFVFNELCHAGESFIRHIEADPPAVQLVAGWFFHVQESEKMNVIKVEDIGRFAGQFPPRTCVEMVKIRYEKLLKQGRTYAKRCDITAKEYANLGMGLLDRCFIEPALDNPKTVIAKPGTKPIARDWFNLITVLLGLAIILLPPAFLYYTLGWFSFVPVALLLLCLFLARRYLSKMHRYKPLAMVKAED